MTQRLSQAAGQVIAVEIDTNLIPILKDTLQDCENVTVINEDILKIDIKKMAEEKGGGRPVKVVANLPYYITTPIIMGLFESGAPIDNITVMVQKEVADRMQVGRRITARCRWRFSIMPSHTSWQMCRRTVSFRVRMSAQRSSV